MACQITILDVTAYGLSGQPVQSITVKGSATDCAAIDVLISCDGNEYSQSVAVAQGLWQASFTNVPCLCDVGVLLRVSARCKANPQCQDAKTVPLVCKPCPQLGEITANPAGPCFRPDDKVVFTVAVNDPGGCVLQYVWIFTKLPGQCTGGINPPCPGASPTATVVELTPVPWISQALESLDGFIEGNWTVQVFIDPSQAPGCQECPPLASAPYLFSIMQPGTCPQVQGVAVQLIGTSGAGYTYRFTATLSGNTAEARLSWNFGSGLTAPQCLCGATVAQTTFTYPKAECEQWKTVAAILEPGNICCALGHAQQTFRLPPCDGPGDGPPPPPCEPWWHPKCWKWCPILLIAALVAIAAAAALFIAAGCSNWNPYLVAAAGAAAVLGLALLGLWAALCSKTQANFCTVLNQLITIFTWIVAVVQPVIVALLALISVPCAWGAVAAWAYYGTVLAYLLLIKDWTNC